MDKRAEYPFAASLRESTSKIVSSFHALPISKKGSLKGSDFHDIYSEIFGDFLNQETSLGQPFLDGLSGPDGSLVEAERLAAVAFGADRTLFTSCGTSVSNEIVIRAIIDNPNMRVLADRGMHQSVHFALKDSLARVEYLEEVEISDAFQLFSINLHQLVERLAQAEKAGRPFECLAFNGHSYEGLIYNVSAIVDAIIEASPSLKVIFVDEAWGAANYFHASTRRLTTMEAARRFSDRGITFISTQSAHKSISALRQSSMIHVKGNLELAARLKTSRYRYHTTSPNLLVIASLDLARAQMESEGEKLVDRSLTLARDLKKAIATKPEYEEFSVCDVILTKEQTKYISVDKSKVLVQSQNPMLSGQKLKLRLFKDHGIYLNRCGEKYVLFNCHIGIDGSDIEHLLESLRTLAREASKGGQAQVAGTSDSFIIPYPPGVPLVMPGEEIDARMLARIQAAQRSGASLIEYGDFAKSNDTASE